MPTTVPTTSSDQPLWTVEGLAAYLGVPKQTIYAWRSQGQGPAGIRVGRHLRFHPDAVERWLNDLPRSKHRSRA